MVYLAPQAGSLQTAASQVPMMGQTSGSMQALGDFQLSAEGSQGKGSTSTQTATVHLSQQLDLPAEV